MSERGIALARVEAPSEESAPQARARLSPLFPKGSVRRMTHLGLLVGSVLDGWEPAPEDSLIYATAHAETRSLEDYLRSFPEASPLGFQLSVHPSAVQQVLIGRQRPLARYLPLAGEATLLEQALLSALRDPSPRVLLVGAEEKGSWLTEAGAGSPEGFAFCLHLVPGEGAAGTLRFEPGLRAPQPCPSLREAAAAVASRTPLAWQGGAGRFELTWR